MCCLASCFRVLTASLSVATPTDKQASDDVGGGDQQQQQQEKNGVEFKPGNGVKISNGKVNGKKRRRRYSCVMLCVFVVAAH